MTLDGRNRITVLNCLDCGTTCVEVDLKAETVGGCACRGQRDWTDEEWALLYDTAVQKQRDEDGPDDSDLPTYDEALSASLPSDAYVNAMRDAGRGELLR